ncbi:MAG: DUF1553 domain-containing protein, partial [Planctomycetaceae bacterium]|nr:DUF1553 domain-containing protein [Planctomycetaceae bacterium]
VPNSSNARDTRQFSHARLRRLRADVLMDSVVMATGVPRGFSGFPEGTRAIDFYPRVAGDTNRPTFGDSFFETFGRASRGTICACETKKEPTLSQTLHLSVGDTLQPRLKANGELKQMVESRGSAEEVITELYIKALSRKPTREELTGLLQLVGEQSQVTTPYEDIFWGLMNSTEFTFNH